MLLHNLNTVLPEAIEDLWSPREDITHLSPREMPVKGLANPNLNPKRADSRTQGEGAGEYLGAEPPQTWVALALGTVFGHDLTKLLQVLHDVITSLLVIKVLYDVLDSLGCGQGEDFACYPIEFVKRHARVILFLVGMPFFHTSRAVIGAGLAHPKLTFATRLGATNPYHPLVVVGVAVFLH